MNKGRVTAREPAPGASLWGMVYADDDGVGSESPEKLRKMMVMVMSVSVEFSKPSWRPC